MNVWHRSGPGQDWRWCCMVVDSKAEEFVERKNCLFDSGEWVACEQKP